MHPPVSGFDSGFRDPIAAEVGERRRFGHNRTSSAMRSRVFTATLGTSLLAAALSAQLPSSSSASHPTPSVASVTGSPAATYTLSSEKRAKAVAYAHARYRLHFLAFFWSVAVLLAIIAARLGPRLRSLAESVSRRRFFQALVFVPLLLATQAVLELPTAAYGHRISLLYDQSVQGWGSWLGDQAKGIAAGLVLAVPLAWLLYALLRGSPRRWWLWFWLASLPVLVFVVFLAPFVFDPLFFRFEPLARGHPELARKIGEVTVRAGEPIPPERMFEMDASSKFKSINAYVTGLGASKRVVVWDTTIEKATIPQTLFVFGHEMGHYVLLHVPKGIAFGWAVSFALIGLAAAVLGRILRLDHEGRWGIRGLADWASLPVLLLYATVATELTQPLVNGFIRHQEHQADVFGLEAIHGIVPDSSAAAASSFQVLGETNLSDPDPSPFIRFWLYDHPPLAERLRFAAEYDPWKKGGQPQYVR
jgi:Zn-dependent protease with chaperone function